MIEARLTDWKRVIDLLPSMVAYWDTELRCRLANRAYEVWFGVNPEALIGRTLLDLLGPELFAKNEAFARRALAGEAQTFERAVPGPGGVVRHSLARYLPDVVDGKVLGFVAYVTDVGALKATQAELERVIASLRSEGERRQLAETQVEQVQDALSVTLASIQAGFVTTDREGRVTRINETAEKMLGFVAADSLGRPLWDVYRREGRPAAVEGENPVALAIRLGLDVEGRHEVVLRTRSDRLLPAQVQGGLTHSAAGEVTGLALVLRDLSDVHRIERRQRDAEERLRLVVESTPDAMLMVDGDGRIRFANAAAERLFGYSKQELLAESIELLVPRRQRDAHIAFRANFMAKPEAGGMGPNRVIAARHRDGTERLVAVGLTPVPTDEGLLVLATASDVTERHQREAELERSNADLEQFAYVASHDLQEPLRTVAAYSELLGKRLEGQLDEKAARYLHHILSAAQRMQQQVKDLLAYSRVGSGRATPSRVACNAVVDGVLADLQASIQEQNATVEVQPLPSVLADESQLAQLFRILLENALKFRGELPPHVVIGAERVGSQVRFRVRDNGIGIEPGATERIFQMFQRLHDRQRFPGNGIGLAIARRIVQGHGGTIWAEPVEGPGAAFGFTLPGTPEE